jgi:hypothetical protein
MLDFIYANYLKEYVLYFLQVLITKTLKIYFSFFSLQVFENAIDPGAVADLLESRYSQKGRKKDYCM